MWAVSSPFKFCIPILRLPYWWVVLQGTKYFTHTKSPTKCPGNDSNSRATIEERQSGPIVGRISRNTSPEFFFVLFPVFVVSASLSSIISDKVLSTMLDRVKYATVFLVAGLSFSSDGEFCRVQDPFPSPIVVLLHVNLENRLNKSQN